MIIIPEIIDITQEEYEMMMKIQKELNLTQQDFINKALKEAIEKYERHDIMKDIEDEIKKSDWGSLQLNNPGLKRALEIIKKYDH